MKNTQNKKMKPLPYSGVHTMIDKTLLKFPEGTKYRLYRDCLLDLSGLTFKVISEKPEITFVPPVDKLFWIRFTRSSSNKIKIQFNEQGVRILGIRDIAEIEFDIHRDEPDDIEVYTTIITTRGITTKGVHVKNEKSNINRKDKGAAANVR